MSGKDKRIQPFGCHGNAFMPLLCHLLNKPYLQQIKVCLAGMLSNNIGERERDCSISPWSSSDTVLLTSTHPPFYRAVVVPGSNHFPVTAHSDDVEAWPKRQQGFIHLREGNFFFFTSRVSQWADKRCQCEGGEKNIFNSFQLYFSQFSNFSVNYIIKYG